MQKCSLAYILHSALVTQKDWIVDSCVIVVFVVSNPPL